MRIQGDEPFGTAPVAIGGNAQFTELIGYTAFFDALNLSFGRWTAGTAQVFTGLGIQTLMGSNALGADGAGVGLQWENAQTARRDASWSSSRRRRRA